MPIRFLPFTMDLSNSNGVAVLSTASEAFCLFEDFYVSLMGSKCHSPVPLCVVW